MPAASDAVVIPNAVGLMVICSCCVSVAPAASRTLAVNADVPRLPGVPLMIPLLMLIASPAGSAAAGVTDQV